MILCNHVKNDLSSIEGTEALLILEVRKFVECSKANMDQIDAYLYRNNNHGVIISSRFYLLYPTKNAPVLNQI